MWDAGRVSRAVWRATEAELLTTTPALNKAQTQRFPSRTKSSRNRLPSVRNAPGSSRFNLVGDHLRLENVLQKIVIPPNSCFRLKVKIGFLVLKEKTV